MPAKSYPFIDIAVHERVREHFAKGDAAVLFSPDMSQVLWSNGEGAFLFGLPSIYDFIDSGANRNDAAYRQMEAAARQLKRSGDSRSFLMRIASGFQRASVRASVEMISVRPGETAILFAAPRSGKPLAIQDRAARMISGFDDPDTHMAVLDGDGAVLAASPGFKALAMTPQTCRSLVTAVTRDSDWLLKRPIPTGKGHLPAAIGKLSERPALHLLFAVETILGNLDPGTDFEEIADTNSVPTVAEQGPSPAAAPLLSPALLPADVIDEIEQIEEIAPEDDAFIDADDADSVFAAETEQPSAEEPAAPVDPVTEEAAPHLDLPSDPRPDHIASDVADPDETADADVSEETAVLPGTDEPVANEIEAGETVPVESIEAREEPVQGSVALDETVVAEVEGTAPADTAADDVAADDDVAAGPADITSEETPADDTSAAEPVQGFVFNPNSRAVRFVWKIDSDGRFSEISEEFAAAVGPNSANITGQSFSDLADRYHLDPGNTISELLKRRDTWSGKTIYWPVEGTALQVPVDLAALPTYSRNREFDGFRGFGIVRVADTIDDAQSMGLTFGVQEASEEAVADGLDGTVEDLLTAGQDVVAEETAPYDTTQEDATSVEHSEAPSEPDDSAEFASELTPPEQGDSERPAEPSNEAPVVDEEEDPFRGERPALKLVQPFGRRSSDKIVQLDSHRPGTEPLSRSEQAAFREIARQLGESVDNRPNETVPVADESATQNLIQDDLSPKTEAISVDDRTDIAEEAAPIVETGLPEAPAPIVPARTSGNSSLTPEFLDNLPLALLVHSGDDLFHANSEFLALTGYSDLDQLREEGGIDALFAGDEDDLFDLPDGTIMLIRNDGQLVPVSARLQSIRWEDTNALMMALSATQTAPAPVAADIQQLDAAAEPAEAPEVHALRMEAEELHSILETATDGVVVVGAEGEIRSVNRSASALFNYDDGEIRGKPFAMLFAHESQKAVLDYLAGLSGHGVASVLNDGREVIGREASGGFIPLFMTMGRLSSSNGFCAVIRDITQWKRTEEELRNAKRAAETANAHKSDFLARVSHEIRTPLNAIIGFSDMMASEHFGPIGNPRYVEYAGDIGRSGRHVLDIVNDLLDISKIEAGEMDLEFTAVEINDAVSEAVSLVQPQANSQRVIIRTSLSGSVPNVVADNRSIKQIALNILSNAIRFTPSGGQIVVSTAYEANGSVILRIRDTGVGMTRTELEQAMKPFRQVTTGARKRGDGTGLGLPLTKAMAEANRAHFSINSAPNEGTLVEISFPSQRVLAN
ncbi:ATP-binding protein [Rhizobium sp. PL01]|uniref:ATP-binding protein n=1 Tax=Rhizobium sp. PL01 TaxID=3085631 RepID=UPI002981B5E4|nr:ATP-binding protein [Rhizobium sp. PL01]MDW5314034.1 PAS domain S-box protein [Rhizobium sp. PL01]